MVHHSRKVCDSSYPKWELEVFCSPDLHSTIIGPDILKVLAADGKQTSSHGRWPRGEQFSTKLLTWHAVREITFMMAVTQSGSWQWRSGVQQCRARTSQPLPYTPRNAKNKKKKNSKKKNPNKPPITHKRSHCKSTTWKNIIRGNNTKAIYSVW